MSVNAATEFRPIIDNNGKRRFDRELTVLLRTRSTKYKELQMLWQCDPDVIQWCDTHVEHWTRLIKQFGYNRDVNKTK